MPITIKDIARMIGVSHATVSRALNNRPGVSSEVKEKIERIVQELDYCPNKVARNLVSKKSQIIGFVNTIDQPNPMLIELIYNIQVASERFGYTVFVNFGQVPDSLRIFLEQRVDGIIVWAQHLDAVSISRIRKTKIPVVSLGYFVDPDIDSVEINRKKAMMIAIDHLVSLGHQRIAYAGMQQTERNLPTAKLAGFWEGMIKNGLMIDPELQIVCAATREGGHTAGLQLMKKSPRPTAVVCQNDLIAIGLLKALRELNIHVPGEVSVVGFDNISESRFAEVPLTTIGQPRESLANQAVELLVQRTEKKASDGGKAIHIMLEAEFIIRQSTGPAPAK